MTQVQIHYPDFGKESSSPQSLSFPSCKLGVITPTLHGTRKTNDKAGEGQAGHEAQCQAQGDAGYKAAGSAPSRRHPGQAGGVQSPSSCAAQAPSAPATRASPERTCVEARLSIWLMLTCVSYWRASLFSPHLVCLPKQAAH